MQHWKDSLQSVTTVFVGDAPRASDFSECYDAQSSGLDTGNEVIVESGKLVTSRGDVVNVGSWADSALLTSMRSMEEVSRVDIPSEQ